MKLAAQFGAAAIVIGSGLRVELFTNDIVAVVVAVVWLVGITNAFNLLDNMDGLAAALATIACAYFAIDAATAHPNDLVLILALSLGFACLGFLPFNLRLGRNAAVFMGDSGSQVLGFALASLGLAASWTAAGTTVATVVLPLIVLAIPILDTTLVTVVRLGERRPVTQGGKDHTSHRLVYYGLSEQEAVALLATVAIALGATGLAYNALDNGRVTSIGVLVSVVLLVQFGNFLAELREQRATGGARPSLVRSLLEPRRLVEIVTDFVLMCASLLVAYLFVFDGYGTAVERAAFLASLPVVLGTRYLFFVVGGIYRRVWRYAATVDELVIAAGVRALCARLVGDHLGAARLPVAAGVGLRPRRDLLHGPGRRLAPRVPAVGRARRSRRRRRRWTGADRGRRTVRSELRARSTRDTGPARRRLPRRQPGNPEPADQRLSGARRPERCRPRRRRELRHRGRRHDRERLRRAPDDGDRCL